jgi:hypothetical protein
VNQLNPDRYQKRADEFAEASGLTIIETASLPAFYRAWHQPDEVEALAVTNRWCLKLTATFDPGPDSYQIVDCFTDRTAGDTHQAKAFLDRLRKLLEFEFMGYSVDGKDVLTLSIGIEQYVMLNPHECKRIGERAIKRGFSAVRFDFP